MVSFTGSTTVGKQSSPRRRPTVKHVALELGGKSAQIYLPDAIDRVATGAMMVVAMTAGQACVAATAWSCRVTSKDDVLNAVSGAYASLTALSTSSFWSRGTTMRVAATHACPAVIATTIIAPVATRSMASGR